MTHRLIPLLALGTGGCLTCDDLLLRSTAVVEAAVAANLDCDDAADCTTVDVSTACMGRCPVAVAVDGVEAVEAAVDQANADWCAGWPPRCGYATPDCAAATVACEDQACVLVWD